MNLKSTICIAVVAAAMRGLAQDGGVEFPDPSAFNPSWESANPGTSYDNTLPTAALLGNGSLGVVNGGDASRKLFVLTRNDLWSCGELTCGTQANNIGPMSFADFEMLPGSNTVGSTDVLDLRTATLSTTGAFGKGKVALESYVASGEDLFIVSGVSSADDVWTLRLSAHREKEEFPREAKANGDGFYVRRSTLNLLPKGDPRGWVTNATAAVSAVGAKIVDARAIDDSVVEANAEIRAGVPFAFVVSHDPARRFTSGGLEKVRADHVAWWREWWGRSRIAIGDRELERYYFGWTYLLGAGVRGGKFPPGLYGLWQTTDYPRWRNDFHMNYNYVGTFYGCFAANRCEVAESMPDPLIDYLPQAVKNAKENIPFLYYYSSIFYRTGKMVLYPAMRKYLERRTDLADGIDDAALFPVGLGPWGVSSEGDRSQLCQISDGVFNCAVACTHWEYTLDRNYLKKVWPLLDKTANFFIKWSEREETADGGYRYVVWDSINESRGFGKNSVPALSCTKHLFRTLVSAAPVLREIGIDVPERKLATWRDFDAHLAPLPVGSCEIDGRTVPILCGTEGQTSIPENQARNAILLESIIPGEAFSFDVTDEFLTLATNTVNGCIARSPERVWTCPNQTPKLFASAIRAGYPPEPIIEAFKKGQIRKYMRKNFTLHDGSHGMEKAGAMEFIHSMLLQCDNGFVKVFPNWTGENAKFENLRAKGCFLLSAAMKKGEVVRVVVKSEKGGMLRLVDPWGGKGRLSAGWKRTRTKNSGEPVIERQFKPGESIVLVKE